MQRGLFVALWSCALAALAAPGADGSISFANDIRPILNKNCVGCHGGVKRAGGISFITRESVVALKPGEDKKPIQPGKADRSELLKRVTSSKPDYRMPPPEHGPALSADQVELLRRWVAQGAKWEPHWAFAAPRAQALPRLADAKWGRERIDYFVLSQLQGQKMKPNPPAAASEWLRRVTFDITGLPPTLQELQALEGTNAPSREAVVDRLLGSPRFGERWATVWLDLARYADSMGFEKDPHRPIWPWRDWVIRALNDNLPYDQFTMLQMAGDLMDPDSVEARLATAFHRNTPTNTEGGTDDEEYRVAAVLDRINTVFEAWQGLTFRCTQCHAHPYEPIEQEEYYAVNALFNTQRDWDLREEHPLLKVPTEKTNYTRIGDLERKISLALREEYAAGKALLDTTTWERLKPTRATSTKGTKLVVAPDGEVRTEGTVAHYSTFEIETPVSAEGVTAVLLEVLPVSPEKARLTPEVGFIASLIEATRGTNAVSFSHAFGDEAEPFQDTQDVLNKNKPGWGAWPRIDRTRKLVLVPTEPVRGNNGNVWRFKIYHDEGPGDFMALVMNRFRLYTTTNAAWTTLVQAPEFAARRKTLEEARKARNQIAGTAVPVLREQEASQARPTALFVRGNWLDKGREVAPGVPALLAGGANVTNRLAFAQWLVATNNPLTARVAVNRVWEQMFGLGLVETLEDFGSSGLPPSNPALLDDLAWRFQHEMKWDLKRLIREIALSATYGQSAKATPEQLRADPSNRWLGRGPRVRLTAEMVRDQALAVSGLFSEKMYGPPVMPPQPDGIWRNAYSSEKWVNATGEDRYRRAIYTYIRRTAGYPSYMTFDAPSRDVCTPRRLRTNTPLQALVTMNDPVYVECSVALARRLEKEGGDALDRRLRLGFQLTTGTQATAEDLNDLKHLYDRTLAEARLATDPKAALADTPERSALALVANALLNLDAALIR